jgi:hypothetical protein
VSRDVHETMEFLRAANPVGAGEVERWAESEEARAIHDRILGTPAGAAQRRQLRWLVLIPAVLAAAFLAMGIASYAYLASRKPENPLAVGCYRALDLQANTLAGIALDGSTTPEEGCAAAWASGFGERAPAVLVSCTVPGGGIGVFPGRDGATAAESCASIGAAAVAEGNYGRDALSTSDLRRWQADLVRALPRCPDASTAERIVLASFARHGMNNWRVEGAAAAGRGCVSLAAAIEREVVILVPSP